MHKPSPDWGCSSSSNKGVRWAACRPAASVLKRKLKIELVLVRIAGAEKRFHAFRTRIEHGTKHLPGAKVERLEHRIQPTGYNPLTRLAITFGSWYLNKPDEDQRASRQTTSTTRTQ